jgi:protein TonB
VKKAFNLILFIAVAAVVHSQDSSSSKADSIYEKAEIEASYPGGPIAWQRYLDNNMPSSFAFAAKNDGVIVVVQFIVDVDGKVSMVKAISGPPERYKETVKLIKKSGKWTPAAQGGRQVKSYKKMPIKFKSDD